MRVVLLRRFTSVVFVTVVALGLAEYWFSAIISLRLAAISHGRNPSRPVDRFAEQERKRIAAELPTLGQHCW